MAPPIPFLPLFVFYLPVVVPVVTLPLAAATGVCLIAATQIVVTTVSASVTGAGTARQNRERRGSCGLPRNDDEVELLLSP